MKWIEFGECDYKIIIPLIYPFLYQIRRIMHENDERFLFGFFTNFCGYLFSGVIYLIVKHRMNRIKSENIEERNANKDIRSETSEKDLNEAPKKVYSFQLSQNQLNLEVEKLKKKTIRNQYLFILLLVLVYLSPMFLDSYTASDNNLNFGTSSSVSLFFYIFFYIFLSFLILGEKIYFHQIISSIIIVISIFVVVILFLIKDENTDNIFLNILIIIIVTCLFALYNVLEKRYYNKYMDSPYHLMFVIGLYAIGIILIYEIFTIIIFGFDFSFNGLFYQLWKNIQKYKFLYILIFIADVLSAFIWIGGIQLTVYFFTPCHFIISESISQIISTFINNTIENFPVAEKVIIYILFVVIFLSTLIYNEIVIINIFSLNKNTKKYIRLRQLTETEDLLTLKTYNDDDFKEEQRSSTLSD